MFKNIALIGWTNLLVYGAFIFLTIYSYSELMDKNENSVYWEILRLGFAIGIIYSLGDWFGLNQFVSVGNYLVMGYLIISLALSCYFLLFEFRKNENNE